MPKRIHTQRLGSGTTAHTRRTVSCDLTSPLSKEDAHELANWFAKAKRRDAISEAKGIAERTIEAINGGVSDPDDFAPYAGMGWYSKEILKRCSWLTKATERGDDASRLVELGYEIGALITEARMKAAWDHDVQEALTTEGQRKSGGGHNRKHPASKYVECYESFRASGNNKTDATALAAEKLSVSPATIRTARKEVGASD